jgi:hypothetical protein
MIIIDDKEYDPAEMTAEQQHLVTQIANCKNKTQIATMDMQIAQVAESQFTAALIASVQSSEVTVDELDG